jgi:phosphate starvation-inducible membrane PsiE
MKKSLNFLLMCAEMVLYFYLLSEEIYYIIDVVRSRNMYAVSSIMLSIPCANAYAEVNALVMRSLRVHHFWAHMSVTLWVACQNLVGF